MADSITGVGTEMRSYYGRPILKEPVWKPEIPFYFFTGGLGGASSALAYCAGLAGHERLRRTAHLVALGADAVSPLLLVSDLGRPERFLNMLRLFKVTSPMSVGSWVLAGSGATTAVGVALERAGRLPRLHRGAELASAALGLPLATYTGTLLANTAIPVWHEARRELPFLFGASAASSAGAAATILLPGFEATPARRFAIGGALAKLAAFELMEARLGALGEPYREGAAGCLAQAAGACSAAGAALLAVRGRHDRRAALAGSALVLAGDLCTRWAAFRAGFASARDPRYVVGPQRARLDARGA